MTAELNRYWTKKARWCDGGMTLLIEEAKNMQDRAADTALVAEVDPGGGSAFRATGRKLR